MHRRMIVLGALGAVAAALLVGAQLAAARTDARVATATSACRLASAKGAIKHVIYIQFDNTHLLRDNPAVPSDLEQMPHLLNFMRNNGTLLSNDHTILISHTAGGILSSLTGVYPDRHGQGVSNSNVRFNGTGFLFPSSFGYWIDPIVATAPTVPNMITADGKNAPAPWVPYTRAGCDFGAIATANTVLENTGTGPSGDMTAVFGTGSPQWNEAEAARLLPNTPANAAAKAKPQTDFVGFAIHCAIGSATCGAANGGRPDLLPDEPGGYTGFQGLFGTQSINPFLTGGSTLNDLAGNPIVDPFGQAGFPGFDGMSASISLAYLAKMQEAGVPVTFAYISDAHDNHGVSGNAHTAYGPGSAGYVAQLKSYDDAFGSFFTRLAADGINKNNTLFVFTVDEGDHFAGVQKTNCDGVHVPCVYGPNEIGEINANIQTLVQHQHPEIPTAWTVHGDSAPTVYVSGNPDVNGPVVRNLEKATASLTAVNPYTGQTDRLLAAVADRTEMTALHMLTGDPLRSASFTFFADPNYFLTDFPATTCETCINPAFAWNHGDIQPEIATTWLGFVGPGVSSGEDHSGQDGTDHGSGSDSGSGSGSGERDGQAQVWSDHTDVQPTMLALLGLRDDYTPDGRVLSPALQSWAVPKGLRQHRETAERLAAVYKQLNAPFGAFGMDTLKGTTRAIQADDATYQRFRAQLTTLTQQRDALAAQIRDALNAAAFAGKALDEKQAKAWIDQATRLISRAHSLS
jgi:hypothetical protein